MARFARIVVPGMPDAITQRGNRRQRTFVCHPDHEAYVEPMAQWCGARSERRIAATRGASTFAKGGEATLGKAARVVRDGRTAPVGGGAVGGAESGPCASGDGRAARSVGEVHASILCVGRRPR